MAIKVLTDRERVMKGMSGRLFDASSSIAEVAREAAESSVLDDALRAALLREVRRVMAVLHAAQRMEAGIGPDELFDILRNPHRLDVRLSVRRPESDGSLP